MNDAEALLLVVPGIEYVELTLELDIVEEAGSGPLVLVVGND